MQPPVQVPTPSTPASRPTGVTILAILAYIAGIWGLLMGCTLAGLGGLSLPAALVGASLPGLALWAGLSSMAYAIFQLAVGYGAWNLRRWAWLVGVIVAGWGALNALFAIFGGSWFGGLLSLIIPGAILFYLLFDKDVKRAFGRA